MNYAVPALIVRLYIQELTFRELQSSGTQI